MRLSEHGLQVTSVDSTKEQGLFSFGSREDVYDIVCSDAEEAQKIKQKVNDVITQYVASKEEDAQNEKAGFKTTSTSSSSSGSSSSNSGSSSSAGKKKKEEPKKEEKKGGFSFW
eukprot:TRINITY_DN692_c0_g1_i1.p1 TRINITY_DN692_c0_g1~~TRINITY_DN692_c0_g1_i1.p1  ORF type:complete len:114 (+),score=42.62 TRINITY_DN692_c0_g1_i1:146-487(+)